MERINSSNEEILPIRLQGLSVGAGKFLLEPVNLALHPGEYFVLLGPTGAGKTLLLETIAGLRSPQQGHILYGDTDVTDLPAERRSIGFVYQDYLLFPHLTVAENIAFGLRRQERTRASLVAEISELLHIEPLLSRWPSTLSGGEQQRVALARALVTRPRLLLLDEPLSALDPTTRTVLQKELRQLHQHLQPTVLHVTHNFEESMAVADRIGVIGQGQLQQVGSPEEIFRRPANRFVAEFVGGRNLFQGTTTTGPGGVPCVRVGAICISVAWQHEGAVRLMVRPEDILLSRQPLVSSARNTFQGHVVDLVDQGGVLLVTVEVPPRFTALITRRSYEDLAIRQGADIYLTFKASAVHLF